ncbi:hypothetical protein GCM10023306_07070 [Novosphingobium ginsenosidimutans]
MAVAGQRDSEVLAQAGYDGGLKNRLGSVGTAQIYNHAAEQEPLGGKQFGCKLGHVPGNLASLTATDFDRQHLCVMQATTIERRKCN